MEDDRPARRFFLLLLAVATLLVAIVIRPLASALLLAAVLAGVLWRLHAWSTSKLGGRRALSSGLWVLVVAVVLVGPLVALATVLLREGDEGLKFVSQIAEGDSVRDLLARLPQSFARVVGQALGGLSDVDNALESLLRAGGGKAVATIWAAASATGAVVFQASMMLIALYFFLVQGDQLLSWLDEALPLRPGQTRELFAEFKKVSFSVIVSAVITAAAQSLAALVGYLISRVPHSLFFAAVTFLVAFVPAVGAASVCLFAAAILYLSGHPSWSLFLALWGIFVVGLVDNVLKPYLAKAGMEMQAGVVFFSLIGGISAFGAIGLVIGPLAVAFFLTLVRMYRRDFAAPPAPPSV
jgi:predicted PurR-regulated permease PerM